MSTCYRRKMLNFCPRLPVDFSLNVLGEQSFFPVFLRTALLVDSVLTGAEADQHPPIPTGTVQLTSDGRGVTPAQGGCPLQ